MKKLLTILLFSVTFSFYCQGQNMPGPVYFDWEKSNADRFVNSPCYKSLGFNPNSDPVEQERRYRECENARRNEKISNISIGTLKVLGVAACVILGLFGLVTPRRRYY